MAFWEFLVKIMQHLWHRFRPHFQPQTTGEQEFLRLLFYFPSNKTALEQYQALSNCSSCINASWPSSFHRIISWRPDRKSLRVRTVNSIALHCSYQWNCSQLLPLHSSACSQYSRDVDDDNDESVSDYNYDETLPKAQRTRGLSSSYQSNFLRSYHEFLHRAWMKLLS